MPSVTFSCPNCADRLRAEFERQPVRVVCPGCSRELTTPAPEYTDGRLSHCLVCPSTELFTRKDFPQQVGVAIVVAGFAASCVTWAQHQVIATFAILFGTALVDVILYVVMGNVAECYRCHAQYRGLSSLKDYEAFDLEIHERHRQQEMRLQEARRAKQPL